MRLAIAAALALLSTPALSTMLVSMPPSGQYNLMYRLDDSDPITECTLPGGQRATVYEQGPNSGEEIGRGCWIKSEDGGATVELIKTEGLRKSGTVRLTAEDLRDA